MDEGVFRVLRALGDGARLDLNALARRSSEAASVVRNVRDTYPRWFETEPREWVLSQKGLAALCREWAERSKADASGLGRSVDAWFETFAEHAAARSPAKRELDQIWATPETVRARVSLLIAEGEVQRGLCLLGDDDLTSVGLMCAGIERRVTVVDVDEDLLEVIRGTDSSEPDASRGVEALSHDLREPLPRRHRQRFGCVMTDPPYAIEGFTLFVRRATEMLRPEGRLYVCFGASRRAPERVLAKQRLLLDWGLLVEAVWENFNRYEGAESIGAASSLWRLRKTIHTKLPAEESAEADLYTSRTPKTP